MNTSYNIVGLVKAAATKSASALSTEAALTQAMLEYGTDTLRKSTLVNALNKLKRYEDEHPLHINTGLYGNTVNTWQGAKENLDRGNYVRGVLGAGLRTPVRAAIDTVMLPLNWADRAGNSGLNFLHRSSGQLQDILDKMPNGHVDQKKGLKLLRAMGELTDAAGIDRADPAGLYANTSNKARVMGTNGGSVYAGFGSPEFAAAMLAVNPTVQSAIADTAMLPVSLPAKLLDSQGMSREEYEKKLKKDKKEQRKQEKSAAYDALMEKAAVR